ncbi:MAG: hypothetical protein ACK5MT_01085 [Actinomycetales bacterium]
MISSRVSLGLRRSLLTAIGMAAVLVGTGAASGSAADLTASSARTPAMAREHPAEQTRVIAYTPASLPTHTVFRPEKVRGKLPVFVWENGGCVNDNSIVRPFLEEVAASGYLVIAKAPIDADPFPGYPSVTETSPLLSPAPGTPLPAPATAGAGTFPREAVSGPTGLMRAAIDWAESADHDKRSYLYKRIDERKVAVSGWSCGGVTAFATAVADSRVDSVIGFNTASSPLVGSAQPLREDLLKLDIPLAWIIGGPSDIAYPGQQADWALPLTAPLFQAEHAYLGHEGTFTSLETQHLSAQITVEWLGLTLGNDRGSARYILGDPCGFCDNPNWTTQTRNWPSRE